MDHPTPTALNVPVVGQLRLESNHDVVLCRQKIRELTQALNFRIIGQTMLVTAVSELARNAIVYGGGGTVTWEVVEGPGVKAGLKLTFVDHGPGIPDIALAMTDGWTSGHGLGLGLSGAKRLVDEFSIHSAVGAGTRISIIKWNF